MTLWGGYYYMLFADESEETMAQRGWPAGLLREAPGPILLMVPPSRWLLAAGCWLRGRIREERSEEHEPSPACNKKSVLIAVISSPGDDPPISRKCWSSVWCFFLSSKTLPYLPKTSHIMFDSQLLEYAWVKSFSSLFGTVILIGRTSSFGRSSQEDNTTPELASAPSHP